VPDVPYLALLLDAGDVLEEVEVEVCAAELAVGNGAEAVLDLLLGYVCDPFVFDFAQLLGTDLVIGRIGAGVEDSLWAQKRSDMVGAIYPVRQRHFSRSYKLSALVWRCDETVYSLTKLDYSVVVFLLYS
jgi:hypothetical protein